MKIVTYPIIFINRIILLFLEYKKNKQLDKTIEIIKNNFQECNSNNIESFKIIYNAILYVLIFEYDITTIKCDILRTVTKRKKNFIARQLATLLYETSQDLTELLGKDFRNSLKSINISNQELNEFNSITKSINSFKNKNRKKLQTLRNFVSAHRDKNAIKQLEIINSVEIKEILDLAGDLYEPVRLLFPFFTKSLNKMSNISIVIKNMKFEVNT